MLLVTDDLELLVVCDVEGRRVVLLGRLHRSQDEAAHVLDDEACGLIIANDELLLPDDDDVGSADVTGLLLAVDERHLSLQCESRWSS